MSWPPKLCRGCARPRRRRGYIAVAAWPQIIALWGALALPALAAPPGVSEQAGLAYGALPQQAGDLYLPAQPGRKPAVLVIHGGGWTEGSRDAWSTQAAALAGLGVVVFNIDYRLAQPGRPDTRWPTQLRDAQLAVRFLRAHAAEFGIDPKRMGAMGDSAGAQMALFLGSLPRPVAGDGAGQYADQPSNVQAVVDQYGPVDIPGMYDGGAPEAAILFGAAVPTAAQFASASPLGSFSSHSAPTLIIQGDSDKTVPPGQSRQVLAALQARHVAAWLVPYPGGHAYAGLPANQTAALQLSAMQWIVAQLRR